MMSTPTRSSPPNRRTRAIERILRRLEVTATAVRPAFPIAAETDTGIWQTAADGRWTGGFWVGLLWLAYYYSGRTHFAELGREWLQRLKPRLAIPNILNGLVFYYGAALGAIILDDREAEALAVEAAHALARCFNATTGVFPLGGDTTEVMNPEAIETNIDSLPGMMLLQWATDTIGEPKLAACALSHAHRLAEACQRADGSLYQAAQFNPQSGAITHRSTPRGFSQHSSWARAQAWSMLGFVQAARRHATFIDTARRVANFWIAQTAADQVAYWDFDDPGIPGVDRDTSATAIAASALLKLASIVEDRREAAHYQSHGEATVDRLVLDYVTPTGPDDYRPAGMLTDGCWQRNVKSFTNNELIWGDYFLLESLLQIEGWVSAI